MKEIFLIISKCLYFSLVLFYLMIFKIQTEEINSLEIVADFKVIEFKIGSENVECKNCMPAGIKLSKNGTIFCSFPRWYDNVTATFAKYNQTEKYFEPWPSLEINQRYKESNSSGINSVLGFEIDKYDNLYILDQGKINQSQALDGSIKLMKFSLENNSLIEEYIFDSEIADREDSFLNDVVIDTDKNIAYISDSGKSKDKNYKPAIIVLDLKNPSNVHRILTNDSSVFPDESFWLHIEKEPVSEKNPMMTGVDGLALSCDGKTLFYCPLTGRMIYSVLTLDIENAIKNGKTNNIKVYPGFKKEASDGLLASSKGNLYMTGIETGSIYRFNDIEEDLLRFDFKEFDVLKGNSSTMWPDTLAMHNGSLYFVSNQLNNFPDKINYTNPKNGKYNFAIFKFNVGNDDSYINGCSGFSNNLGKGTIFICILLGILILVVLSFVLMGSNNQEEVIDKHMNLGVKED